METTLHLENRETRIAQHNCSLWVEIALLNLFYHLSLSLSLCAQVLKLSSVYSATAE